MSKKITFILLKLPLILVVLFLSIGNAHVVPFHILPFGLFGTTLTLNLPLFLLGFLFFILGSLFGYAAHVFKTRFSKRTKDKAVKKAVNTELDLG